LLSYLADGIHTTWVGEALVLVKHTLRVGVANIIGRTGTPFVMSDALALGIETACVGQEAEVDTGAFHTALGSLAVPASYTLHPATLHLGVALQPLGTQTDRTMVGHPALGSWRTSRGRAGVLALPGMALLLVRTVGVPGAPWETGSAPALVSLGTRQGTGALLSTSTGDTGLAARAGADGGAGLNTDSVSALPTVPAVGGLAAGVGDRQAALGGVAGGGGGTGAEGLMVGHGALSTLAA
jgi:hypothetical protein